jgi:hypothetical protein
MIRIPLDVDHPAIPALTGVNDGSASHPAIAADRGGFFGILGLQKAGVGFDRFQVKAQTADSNAGSSDPGNFHKVSSVEFHKNLPPWRLNDSLVSCYTMN